MKTIPLWQVELTSPVTFFDQSVVEIIHEPELISVPYCHELMHEMLAGREQWVPVLRLHESFECLLLLRLIDHEECEYLAITCNRYPKKIMVTDADFSSDHTLLSPLYKQVSVSAVEYKNETLPIINPSLLLTDEWLAMALSFSRQSC